MSSYVYMKILESQPERYDRGIALLSLGAAPRTQRRLVAENVCAGMRVLEIGCGTGSLALLAARAGAHLHVFDVSPGMLEVARRKVQGAELEDRIELFEMGVSGMDSLAGESFDLVVATLVFSELSGDEQRYALAQAYRVLRPGGRIALADEVRPDGRAKRILHGLVRSCLLVVTFALTQTTTRAVEGLPEEVARAGFRIEKEERSSLGSFLYLLAHKQEADREEKKEETA